jgi:hypothetical protein
VKLSLALDRTTALLAPDLPIMLVGPPGLGKTDGITDVALRRGEQLVTMHPGTSIPEDYRGIPRVLANGDAEWLPIGVLRKLVDPACPPTLLLIDDVAQARPPVQAALMHVVRARQVGDATLASTVSIVLCSNRRSHDIAANAFSAPLINRVLRFDVEHDYEAFATWAIAKPDIDQSIASYALFRRDCFVTEIPSEGEDIPFCSPRSLALVGNILHRLPRLRCVETLAGAIGKDAAQDLVLYRQSLADLVPFAEVLADPSIIRQVNDPGLVHAYIVQAAAHAAIEPGKVRVFSKDLHGELRELLECLAPSILA